jgi:hypothetical protein
MCKEFGILTMDKNQELTASAYDFLESQGNQKSKSGRKGSRADEMVSVTQSKGPAIVRILTYMHRTMIATIRLQRMRTMGTTMSLTPIRFDLLRQSVISQGQWVKVNW